MCQIFKFVSDLLCYALAILLTCDYRTVRSSAALALGKLSGLSTRVDPLVGDLLSSLQVICLFIFIVTDIVVTIIGILFWPKLMICLKS